MSKSPRPDAEVQRGFTLEEFGLLRQVVRKAVTEAERRLEGLDAAGTPWASPEVREAMIGTYRRELDELQALRRAVL